MSSHDYHRRSIRLPDYDYRQAGAYFVTIVAYQREDLFGSLDGQQVHLNTIGQVVDSCWRSLPETFPVELDEWIIMPNHLHAILFLQSDELVRDTSPQGLPAGSLGAILRNFKSITTQRVNKIRRSPGQPAWQRNYYEHILRSSEDLEATRQYILENPTHQEDDPLW